MKTKINWTHGLLRLWILLTVMWCIGAALWASLVLNIAWPSSAPYIVHVEFSDTETWDYPAEWGVERIAAAVKERARQEAQKARDWLAAHPEAEKAAACNKKSDQLCYTWEDEYRAEPTGWESQLLDAPLTLWGAATMIAPWIIGPPLLVLALGLAIAWVLAGFSRRHIE